jgi:hypothetical protein|tara:strand:+ start:374 stop:508 length:135 start_codon:yes stop_codon:yes gene_type:complete
MEILLWIIFTVVISKTLLKAVAPYTNRALDDKLKEYWKNLKEYF